MAERRTSRVPAHEIEVLRLVLTVRWNTVLLPFEQPRFVSALPDEGYVLSEEVVRAGRPFGGAIEVSGRIARKGNTTLVMDPDKLTMGLESKSAESLVADFENLEELLRRQVFFDSARSAWFHEFVEQMLVWSDRSPIATFRSANIGGDLGGRLAGKAGFPNAANVSMRLAPAEGTPLDPYWWDIQIEPSFRSPERCLRFTVVYRSPQREEVMEFGRGIEKTALALIAELEGRNG